MSPWTGLAMVGLLGACASTGRSGPAAEGAPAPGTATREDVVGEPGVLVGIITRQQIEAALPAWAEARDGASPDPDAARALTAVPAGAAVDVALGTWCGDSRREVTRLWKALDLAGGPVPFTIRWIGVDRAKRAPGGLIDGWDVQFVPTFIVRRGGHEVGRIVESAPEGIENDLLALLRGERTGTITNR